MTSFGERDALSKADFEQPIGWRFLTTECGVMECSRCHGTGFWSGTVHAKQATDFCGVCGGVGYRDVPSASPCPDLPSTKVKLAYLSARWRDGLPLFHPLDARDSGR